MDLRQWQMLTLINGSASLPPHEAFVQNTGWMGHGWIDVILQRTTAGHMATIVGAVRPHDKPSSYKYETTPPEPDLSDELSKLWCSGQHLQHYARIAEMRHPHLTGSAPYMRLSFRQLTHTRFASDAFRESVTKWAALPLSCHPQAVVLQSGSWDVASRTDPHVSRKNLLQLLTELRNSSRLNQVALAFVGLTVPWVVSRRECERKWKQRCGETNDDDTAKWQQEIVDQANHLPAIDGAPRVAFINRIINHSAPAPCQAFNATCSSRWHPPHAVNAAIVPDLLEVLFRANETHAGHVEYDGVRQSAFLRRVSLMQSEERCCCGPPPAALDTGDSTVQWIKECHEPLLSVL